MVINDNENFMIHHSMFYYHFTIVDNFNINLLDYKNSKEVKSFVDILGSSLITPTISLPTRITTHSSTLTDYILVLSLVRKSMLE